MPPSFDPNQQRFNLGNIFGIPPANPSAATPFPFDQLSLFPQYAQQELQYPAGISKSGWEALLDAVRKTPPSQPGPQQAIESLFQTGPLTGPEFRGYSVPRMGPANLGYDPSTNTHFDPLGTQNIANSGWEDYAPGLETGYFQDLQGRTHPPFPARLPRPPTSRFDLSDATRNRLADMFGAEYIDPTDLYLGAPGETRNFGPYEKLYPPGYRPDEGWASAYSHVGPMEDIQQRNTYLAAQWPKEASKSREFIDNLNKRLIGKGRLASPGRGATYQPRQPWYSKVAEALDPRTTGELGGMNSMYARMGLPIAGGLAAALGPQVINAAPGNQDLKDILGNTIAGAGLGAQGFMFGPVVGIPTTIAGGAIGLGKSIGEALFD